jgi:hypothetical protein
MPATTDIAPKWSSLSTFPDAVSLLGTELKRAKNWPAFPKQKPVAEFSL